MQNALFMVSPDLVNKTATEGTRTLGADHRNALRVDAFKLQPADLRFPHRLFNLKSELAAQPGALCCGRSSEVRGARATVALGLKIERPN